jgi:hypothetical protein
LWIHTGIKAVLRYNTVQIHPCKSGCLAHTCLSRTGRARDGENHSNYLKRKFDQRERKKEKVYQKKLRKPFLSFSFSTGFLFAKKKKCKESLIKERERKKRFIKRDKERFIKDV